MTMEETQVLVTFRTRLPAELRVPETPVAVPSNLKRFGLSQIINHLLALEPARPFDFLVDGELLRKSLEQHLLEKGISTEVLLEIEYIPAVVPPEPKSAIPHDDWVSAVDAFADRQFIAGSYDGLLRLYGEDSECACSYLAHEGPINAVASVPGSGNALAVTAGKDHAVRLWHLHRHGKQPEWTSTRIASFSGHTDCVEAVAVSPDGGRLATGSWDGSLRLWRCGEELMEAHKDSNPSSIKPRAAKKKKKEGTVATRGVLGSIYPQLVLCWQI